MRVKRLAALLAILWLTACGVENFDFPGARGDDAAYLTLFPYYAEFCALSQIKKKPGFGADIRGEIGGHAVFYLNGACRDGDGDYPALHVCDEAPTQAMDGVGISVNAHFSNAKWAAIPGRRFFFRGDLKPDMRLTRDAYQHTQDEAKRRRIYDAIDFHSEVFQDMPDGMSRQDYKYEVSVATDYAIEFGRGRYCNRVPVSRAQMVRMVNYLNAQNAPYRDGTRIFHWSVFQDNCVHLAHNALAAASMWEQWPIERTLLVSIFDFPVPKNEFVNIARRTNDLSLLDPATAYRDLAARQSVVEFDVLPASAGSVAEAHPPVLRNDVYDTDLRLIFYDDPAFGSYQRWFDAIFASPVYSNLEENLARFASTYDRVLARRPSHGELAVEAGFDARFYHAIERARDGTGTALARLRAGGGSGMPAKP